MPTPKPTSIIKPSPRKRQVMYRDGDTADIIRVIMHADRMSGQFVDSATVDALRGPDDYHTLENIYWFVKRNVQYRPDRSGHEEVRSPGYLFDTRLGDCKSMSVAIGALCRAFGIPYQYRFVRQRGAHNYHHVYVIAFPADGSARGEVILDAVHRSFDSEAPWMKKLDLKPGQRIPASIGELKFSLISVWPLLLLLLLWFASAKKVRK